MNNWPVTYSPVRTCCGNGGRPEGRNGNRNTERSERYEMTKAERYERTLSYLLIALVVAVVLLVIWI